MTAQAFDAYLTLYEAADRLGVHHMTLRRLIREGISGQRLPARMHAGRYLVHRDDLERVAATYQRGPGRKQVRRLL
jgi:excisionase family DNA binding protein